MDNDFEDVAFLATNDTVKEMEDKAKETGKACTIDGGEECLSCGS